MSVSSVRFEKLEQETALGREAEEQFDSGYWRPSSCLTAAKKSSPGLGEVAVGRIAEPFANTAKVKLWLLKELFCMK